MKAYWIARVTVSSPEQYRQYADSAPEAIRKYNGRFLARAGRTEQLEGTGRPRNVVIEFDSFEKAKACYDSPEYQAALKIREQASTGDLVIIEGYEGPQP